MNIEQRLASIADMERIAYRRMPRFARDYLFGGLGPETAIARNREALNTTCLLPLYHRGSLAPSLGCSLLGGDWSAPFGVAPLGLAGLLWPGSETRIAQAARHHGLPYGLSTYANTSTERSFADTGCNGWFQYYPSNDDAMAAAMIERAERAGYEVILLTVDIPIPARRERDIRNGVAIPPKFDFATLLQIASHPAWALAMLRNGIPDFEILAPHYPNAASLTESAEFLGRVMKGHITREIFRSIRAAWKGRLVVKGILDIADAEVYLEDGADGILVSNHGGRQLDAAPAAATVLPGIRRAIGNDVPIIADGGIRSGLDIARMLALGADFVLLGRPFLFAVAADPVHGAGHAMALLKDELQTTMIQLGCTELLELRERLFSPAR